MVMHSLVQNCSPIGPSLRWCRGEGRVRWGWGGNGLKWPVYFLFSRSSVTKSLTPMPYSSLPRAWQGLLWVKHVAPKKIRNILLPYTALKGLTHAGPTGPWIHIRRPRARGQWELGPLLYPNPTLPSHLQSTRPTVVLIQGFRNSHS